MEKIILQAVMVNANTVVLKSPGIVGNICIAGDGANGDCDIYDGENANAERKYHLEVLSGSTAEIGAGHFRKFNHGIYIVVNASTTFVTVEYLPLTTDGKIPG